MTVEVAERGYFVTLEAHECMFCSFKFFIFYFILFLLFSWLRWVFVAVRGLSLVAVSRVYSSLQRVGFQLWWLLLLRSMGSRCAGSVVVFRGL